MAHPIIEALYIGLLTTGMTQPGQGSAESIVATVEPPAQVIEMRRERTVYDWSARRKTTYRYGLEGEPLIGLSEDQLHRLAATSTA